MAVFGGSFFLGVVRVGRGDVVNGWCLGRGRGWRYVDLIVLTTLQEVFNSGQSLRDVMLQRGVTIQAQGVSLFLDFLSFFFKP